VLLIISRKNCCNLKEAFSSIIDPIDVVYTWVNSDDEQWKLLKNKHKLQFHKNFDNKVKRWNYYNDPASEIKLSIESVRMYLPWIRNIYVVTQRPQNLPEDFMNKHSDIIKIVHHDQIMNKDVLPTFSSVSIESSLHKIPGLSEKFIYFNDDNYINKPMKPSDFFKHNKPILRVNNINSNSYNKFVMPVKEVHNQQNYNTKKILNSYFNVPIHQATPITKTIMKQTENKYIKEWNLTKQQKFRTRESIIPIYLALNYGLQNGKVNLNNDDVIKNLFVENEIYKINNNYHLVCVNDKCDIDLLRKKVL